MTRCPLSDDPQEKKQHDVLAQLLQQLGIIVAYMGKAAFLTPVQVTSPTAACKKMGKLYENLFETPDATITPKLHIVVEHVPQFAGRFQNVGLISEHGLESLHAEANVTARRYALLREGF